MDASSEATISVIHLERASLQLNLTRSLLGFFALTAAWVFVWWAAAGQPEAALQDRFRGYSPAGSSYWGQGLVPATLCLLLAAAMMIRSPSLAWGAIMLLSFIGLFWFTSVGFYPLFVVMLLAPAVWDYHHEEERHRVRKVVPAKPPNSGHA